MRAPKTLLAAAAGVAILTGCGNNDAYYNALVGESTQVDVQDNSALEFRVGTARFSDGTVGLNTVVTFRSTSGGAAATTNTPKITGPTGFVVPDNAQTDPSAAGKNTDVGTNTISGTPSGGTAITTFGTFGGAFAYGFENINVVFGTNPFAEFVTGVADNTALYEDQDSPIVIGTGKGNVQNTIGPKVLGGAKIGAIGNAYPMPLYAAEGLRLPFILGPPAVTDFHNANYSSAFLGYDSGFTSFAATPVAGSYTLAVAVPSTTQQMSASFTATAALSSVTPLGAESAPIVINSTGDGGATFTVGAPPSGVTNQLLYVVDVSVTTGDPTMYTCVVPTGGGVCTYSATSGPIPSGATTGSAPFVTGDSVYAYVVGSDYDIIAASSPINVSESPALATQCDITVSEVHEIIYPKAGVTGPQTRTHVSSARRATTTGHVSVAY
ncbi:MAG TPA: hypothetical protein VHT05_14895 [Candidatus Elarobacter sp.]|nr:hypothetical protein [Candidatus Elarobacter sp.]